VPLAPFRSPRTSFLTTCHALSLFSSGPALFFSPSITELTFLFSATVQRVASRFSFWWFRVFSVPAFFNLSPTVSYEPLIVQPCQLSERFPFLAGRNFRAASRDRPSSRLFATSVREGGSAEVVASPSLPPSFDPNPPPCLVVWCRFFFFLGRHSCIWPADFTTDSSFLSLRRQDSCVYDFASARFPAAFFPTLFPYGSHNDFLFPLLAYS